MRPCFGLDFGFFAARRQRRFGLIDPLLAHLQAHSEAAELTYLTDSVFIRPTAFRQLAAPATFAEAMQQASPKRAAALEKAASVIARRLAQLAEAHRLANTITAAEPDALIATPTAAELDTLYAFQQPVLIAAPPEPDTGTTLHLVPALLGPPRAAETPPISVAA